MHSTGIVGLQHAVAHMCQTGGIRVAWGGGKGAMPPKVLKNVVIVCFEWRFSKQNSVFA